MDASPIVVPSSLISGTSSCSQRCAVIPPASRFAPSEAIFCEPIRHGTHFPQDSLRKNSSDFTASATMSRVSS